MENWGLLTYRESYLLYDPAKDSASAQEDVADTVAHEIAHQWFGNLVSPEVYCMIDLENLRNKSSGGTTYG